jgi:hypothetical protein
MMATEAFDYKQIAVDYLLRRAGETVFMWEEQDDPDDDFTAHTESSSYLPSDHSGNYSWTSTEELKFSRIEILGRDDDQPELTIVYLETEEIYSSGTKSDNDDSGSDTYETNYCVWVNENGEVCDCSDENLHGFDDELQARIDRLVSESVSI